jgi:putative transcriptional regulator
MPRDRVRSRVREHRERLGLTQEGLAQSAGVSRQSINSIERGRYVPSLSLALKFARLFQMSTDDLFQLVEEEE